MPSLEVFQGDPFTTIQMTDAINKVPFTPGRAGSLGIFEEFGVPTDKIMVEERDGQIALIPVVPRGGPANENAPSKRTARPLVIPHLPLEDTIQADEIRGVRLFGTESMLETAQTKVNEKLADMARKHDATLEHMRVGALKGQILDADGSTVLLDLFQAFGVTALPDVNFNFASATVGDIRKNAHNIQRDIEDELGAVTFDHVHSFCGRNFYDDLVTHSEVSTAYERWIANGQPGEFLRMPLHRRAFPYAGIIWEEYRGKVGSIDFIPDDEARFFPVGAPGVFRNAYAPADFMETVNTIGLPRYAKQAVDAKYQRFVEIHTQSNPLPYCTRPRTLVRGTRS